MVELIKKGVKTVAEKIASDVQTRLTEENSAVMRNIAEVTDIVELNRETQAIEPPAGLLDVY